MKQRLITAIGIILLVSPPLLLGGIALDLLIVLFATIGIYEIINVVFKRVPTLLYAFTVCILIMMGKLSISMFIVGLVLVSFIYFSLPVLYEEYKFEECVCIIALIVILSLAVRSIYEIYSVSNLIMVYVAVATYATDTGAYFSGRFFGKHKLNTRISPNKTIEGSIGGAILGACVSFIFGLICLNIPMLLLVCLSLLLPICGQMGDLIFSAIKRQYDVKDFGNLFPGHGGILDRIDSLVINLTLYLALVLIIPVI